MNALRTERLDLRPLVPEDLDALAAILGDPVGMASWPAPLTHEESRAWIERNLARYEADGFGRCAIVWRESGELVGDAGLVSTEVEGTPEIELGWIVRHDMKRRGIATEAAAAWRDFAFEVLGLSRIVSMIDEANAPSRRVAEKLGMSVEREAIWGDQPMLMYSAERP
ncbi:MAG TPA: GNAT family N-acetyltransferase [Actinomycetota bacterium]|jgi:RimJ/RimL family protein N-acetyltransferase|nr:GNAT family N-acetyltransferase [Actinomycetota bacterium]